MRVRERLILSLPCRRHRPRFLPLCCRDRGGGIHPRRHHHHRFRSFLRFGCGRCGMLIGVESILVCRSARDGCCCAWAWPLSRSRRGGGAARGRGGAARGTGRRYRGRGFFRRSPLRIWYLLCSTSLLSVRIRAPQWLGGHTD